MNAPWSTLFHGYEEHWLLGQYLKGDEPLWDAIEADPKRTMLSSGETTLLHVATLFRPFREGTVYALDRPHRTRIAIALLDL